MCATNKSDNPQVVTTPEQRELENHLCFLAGAWRSSFAEPKLRDAITREYYEVLDKLLSGGWNSVLDMECELPSDYMPACYKARYEHEYPGWPPQ